MKVLFWLSMGFDRRGPSEHLLIDMIEALYANGHTVHVLQKNTSGPQPALPERLQKLGVETTCIPFKLPAKTNLAARFLADVKYVLCCFRWLSRNSRFDRVFLQSANVAGIQTRLLPFVQRKVPVVFNVQDIFPENAMYSGKMKANGIVYKCFSFMQRHAYRYASRIITISEDMKDQLVEIGTPADKIEVVYNWSYRDTMYDPSEINYSCLDGIIDRSKFNVVYAGNIGVMQNVEIVIRAAALMKDDKDVCFHVIGDGAYRKKLEQLAVELQTDNVYFHDMMPSACAPAIYSAADVNIIPLAENIYRTALPSKTATCLACGKPIIFTIGKESKFVQALNKSRTGISVDSGDVQAFCEALEAIRENSSNCYPESVFMMNFGKTHNSQQYAKFIESV